MPTRPPSRYTKHPEYYFEYVYIQVEDELFKLPRYKFEEESDVFLFLAPGSQDEAVKRRSTMSWVPEKPLLFQGFSKNDFMRFLVVFFPRGLCASETQPSTGTDVEESVLKVATAMHLTNTREKAIDRLRDSIALDTCARLVLGMKYWEPRLIKDAFSFLVAREAQMSEAEAKLTGFETAFRIAQARENMVKRPDSHWFDSLVAGLEPQRPRWEIIFPRVEVPERPALKRNPKYFSEEIVFLVEDKLFNVARYPFSNDSEIFSDMFSVPCSQGGAEGNSESNPISLEGVSKGDFALLLLALHYPPSHKPRRNQPWHRLAALLKLATMWRFKTVREETIQRLEELFSAVKPLRIQQLILGQSQKVPSWILDGYYHLSISNSPLTAAERKLLTPATIWTIIELRDTYQASYCPCSTHEPSQLHYLRRVLTKEEVKERIAEELGEAEIVWKSEL